MSLLSYVALPSMLLGNFNFKILKNEGNENVSTSTILWSLIFLFPFCLYQEPWANLNPSIGPQ